MPSNNVGEVRKSSLLWLKLFVTELINASGLQAFEYFALIMKISCSKSDVTLLAWWRSHSFHNFLTHQISNGKAAYLYGG